MLCKIVSNLQPLHTICLHFVESHDLCSTNHWFTLQSESFLIEIKINSLGIHVIVFVVILILNKCSNSECVLYTVDVFIPGIGAVVVVIA
jgi:hypothetical protein